MTACRVQNDRTVLVIEKETKTNQIDLNFIVGLNTVLPLTFKYNTRDLSDGARTDVAVGKIDGKRLSLRPLKSKSAAREMSKPLVKKAAD